MVTFVWCMQTLGNFSLYDYRKPHAVPDELKGAFSVVVADPPYLVRSGCLAMIRGTLHPIVITG